MNSWEQICCHVNSIPGNKEKNMPHPISLSCLECFMFKCKESIAVAEEGHGEALHQKGHGRIKKAAA